jgi:hypothetical protein
MLCAVRPSLCAVAALVGAEHAIDGLMGFVMVLKILS